MLLQLQGELPLLQAARSSREPSCMGNMIHHVCSTATALTCTLCSAQRQTNSMCVDKLSGSALTRSMISTGCISPGGRRCTLAAWARRRANFYFSRRGQVPQAGGIWPYPTLKAMCKRGFMKLGYHPPLTTCLLTCFQNVSDVDPTLQGSLQVAPQGEGAFTCCTRGLKRRARREA